MPLSERTRRVLTPEQAASYLQVDRDTVYRYIREGKLMASRLGRYYRISTDSLETLLWATRTRADVTLRQYTSSDIAQFLSEDELTDKQREIARRFMEANTAN